MEKATSFIAHSKTRSAAAWFTDVLQDADLQLPLLRGRGNKVLTVQLSDWPMTSRLRAPDATFWPGMGSAIRSTAQGWWGGDIPRAAN
jgi:hypothetical protein